MCSPREAFVEYAPGVGDGAPRINCHRLHGLETSGEICRVYASSDAHTHPARKAYCYNFHRLTSGVYEEQVYEENGTESESLYTRATSQHAQYNRGIIISEDCECTVSRSAGSPSGPLFFLAAAGARHPADPEALSCPLAEVALITGCRWPPLNPATD